MNALQAAGLICREISGKHDAGSVARLNSACYQARGLGPGGTQALRLGALFSSVFKPLIRSRASSAAAFTTHRTGNSVADDSKASNVGERYAQALFDLANEENTLAAVEADLRSLKAALAESRDLKILLASPAFPGEDKAKGLSAVATAAEFHATPRKFLGLLAANGRASQLASVVIAFEALSTAARGVVAAKVTTAVPLTPAQSKGVAAALRQALGKD